MSTTTQLQMAPQSTLVQVSQNPNHSVITSAAASSNQNNQENSNMSTGSSHSDKEADRDVITQAIMNNTPEKLPRQQTERKRKRKQIEDNGTSFLRVATNAANDVGIHNSKQRISLSTGANDKKINDYFLAKLPANSTRHPGAKSPSPQHGTYPMFPPSPQPPLVHTLNVNNQDYFKPRTSASNAPTAQPPILPPPASSSTVNHQNSSNAVMISSPTSVVAPQQNLGTSSSSSSSNSQSPSNLQQVVQQPQQQPALPQQQQTILPNPAVLSSVVSVVNQNNQQQQQAQQQQQHSLSIPGHSSMVSKAVQTDLTLITMQDRDVDSELIKTKIDDMTRASDEQKSQIAAQTKLAEQQKDHISKCIDVVKKLLKQKSNIEKKEARQKCMQNRLRLGQFVTQRVGATFQENWTDGYAFQELARRQEEISSEREEIDKQKKSLIKKKPTNAESGRKRNSSAPSSSTSSAVVNGGDATFLKPEPVSSNNIFTIQEYYECDEILKLRTNALKKEDADLQLEMEKLERERNLHIRELKRIHNEDQVRFLFMSSILFDF
jgi:tousled-like kinase